MHEVAFGADLVARAFAKLLEDNSDARYIATPCPAVVSFVRKYHPDLTPSLAPIVSPMIAMSRVLHDPSVHGPDAKVVFIGPCIAKKGEAASADILFEIDAVLDLRRAAPDVRRAPHRAQARRRRLVRPAARLAGFAVPAGARPAAGRRICPKTS